VIEDSSGVFEKAGRKAHVIGTGWMKGVGTEGSPINDRQLADLKREVDEANSEFIQDVSSARGISAVDVLGLEARVFVGKNAKSKRLVDEVTTIDEFFAKLKRNRKPENPEKGTSPERVEDEEEPKLSDSVKSLAFSLPNGKLSVEAKHLGDAMTTVTGDATVAGDRIDVMSAECEIGRICMENGIASVNDARDLIRLASMGREYESQIRTDAKAQAVRAYGAEVGLALFENCDALPAESLMSLRNGWKAEADAKFGVGEGIRRRSAPLAIAVQAEGNCTEALWEKLGEGQRAFAEKMGIEGNADRERFASLYFDSVGGDQG
jgi:hypothetical protein